MLRRLVNAGPMVPPFYTQYLLVIINFQVFFINPAMRSKSALIVDEVTLTFSQLTEMAEAYVRRFAGLGVGSGQRVCLFMGNRVEPAGLYLACFRLGAVAVPLSCYYKPDEVKYAVAHCDGRFLIVEPELVSGVANMAFLLILEINC